MDSKNNILGFFVSISTIANSRQEEPSQGELFRGYIWGEDGISGKLSVFEYDRYGSDIKKILFQFEVNPPEFLKAHLKEIESFRSKEKAIGVPVIVDQENFFKKTEKERNLFIKQIILYKIDLLSEVVKKKKFDTDIEKLKTDVESTL